MDAKVRVLEDTLSDHPYYIRSSAKNSTTKTTPEFGCPTKN